MASSLLPQPSATAWGISPHSRVYLVPTSGTGGCLGEPLQVLFPFLTCSFTPLGLAFSDYLASLVGGYSFVLLVPTAFVPRESF